VQIGHGLGEEKRKSNHGLACQGMFSFRRPGSYWRFWRPPCLTRWPPVGLKSCRLCRTPPEAFTPFWSDPSDWATRDLLYGPGGKAHEPHGPFTFEREDQDGSNRKCVVRDVNGVKWKAKVGLEARSETVAARLVWAAGYYANEDYFVSDMRIGGRRQASGNGTRWASVSDLGASFGPAGRTWPPVRAKDNLNSYSRAGFIRRLGPDTVDFQTPARPTFVYVVGLKAYFRRVHLEHLGRNVPRADAKWLGQLLARLSPAQIQDAFRAAGYSPEEIQAFTRLLESRITLLTDL